MAYRLKSIRYKGSPCRILLQNENGPCPLLAACNVLLLRRVVEFPPSCIRNGVASLEDVTNMLANQALQHHHSSSSLSTTQQHQQEQHQQEQQEHHYFLHELLTHIPTFQYGMDVNPSFTQGICGYEWTAQLSSFDVLRVKLVHGWLVDPDSQSEVHDAVQSDCYNALVEKIIHARDASDELDAVQQQLLKDTQSSSTSERQQRLMEKAHELTAQVTRGSLIEDFLNSSAHQLTDYGLRVLHEQLEEDELVVFFRNNHFGTLTKHQGLLYLLVTDLGYANTPDIVWEKLDVIDGDTELVNSEFLRAGEQSSLKDAYLQGPTLSPEQLLAQSSQKDADYQLALHLSLQDQSSATTTAPNSATLDDQEGQLIAAATEESLRSYHGISTTSATTMATTSAPSVQQPTVAGPCGGTTGTGASGGTMVVLPPVATSPQVATMSNVTVAVGIPLGSSVSDTVKLMNQRYDDSSKQNHAASSNTTTATTTAISADQNQQQHKQQEWMSQQQRLISQHEADQLLAMQLQNEHEEASLHLARKLQAEEDARQRQQPQRHPLTANPRPTQRRPVTSGSSSSTSNSAGCVIS